jgi:hypothetical protein
MATLPTLSDLWAHMVYITPPVLPYVVVRAWTSVAGAGDDGLRLLGLLEGLGAACALWYGGRSMSGRVPMLSLGLFGLNASVIQFGDSPRGYGLAAMFILLTYALVWRFVESGNYKVALLAAVLACLSVHTVFQNAILLLAICTAGTLVCLRRKRWSRGLLVLGVGAVAALSLLSYVPIIQSFQSVAAIAQVDLTFAQILEVLAAALSGESTAMLAIWIAAIAASLLSGAYQLLKRQADGNGVTADRAVFSLCTLLIAVPSFFIMSRSAGFEVNPWHCIALVAVAALCIEVLISAGASSERRRFAVAGIAAVVAIIATPLAWSSLGSRRTNVDLIASAIRSRAGESDLVVVTPWFDGITFRHYYFGPSRWMTAPPMADLSVARSDLLRQAMMQEQPLQEVFEGIRTTLESGSRVWIAGVLAAPGPDELPPSLPPAPNGPGGWYSGYYMRAWTLQLGHYLQSHALRREQVRLPLEQPISQYEYRTLWVFTGWRP